MSEEKLVEAMPESTKDQALTEVSKQYDADIMEMENGLLAMIVDGGLERKLDEVHQQMVKYLKQDGQDMTWLLTDIELSRLEHMCGRKSNGFPKLFVLLHSFLLQLAVVKKVKALIGPTSSSYPQQHDLRVEASKGSSLGLIPPLKVTADQIRHILRLATIVGKPRATLEAEIAKEYGTPLVDLPYVDAEEVLSGDFLFASKGSGGQARVASLKEGTPPVKITTKITADQIEEVLRAATKAKMSRAMLESKLLKEYDTACLAELSQLDAKTVLADLVGLVQSQLEL